MNTSREQVIAYRIAAHGLYRDGARPLDLAVLSIGVQDSVAQGARLAFDARLPAAPPSSAIGPGRSLALCWSLRGAPHVHRRRDLDALAGALWPLSADDAGGRMNQTRPHLRSAGLDGLAAYEASVSALRSVVAAPMAKGAVSSALTPLVPDALTRYCRVCKATHIGDPVLRSTALGAGLELEPETAPPVLVPRSKARWPVASDPVALRRLIVAYLTLLGPATVSDVAGYLEARRADIEQCWPDGLTEVPVAGSPAWLPTKAMDGLRGAPAPKLVRLLNPYDPYLQARDRDLIVPDKARQKALWPILGRPGVVLVDGEVVAMWRPRSTGATLTVTVTPFAALAKATWAAIEDEAARVAAVRGAAAVRVVRS